MAPRLILINGVPASGKSTLARAWCERNAAGLPWCVDIDTIRSMLGGWRDDLHAAGMAARDIAIAGIAAQLGTGRDVAVPQYLRRPEFIDRLRFTAAAHSALFIETALLIDAAEAEARFRGRADSAAADIHGELHDKMSAIIDDFAAFLESRPATHRIAAGGGALDELDAAITRAEASAGH